MKGLTPYPYLPSYISTNLLNSGLLSGILSYQTNIGNEFDLENDSVPEIIISEIDSMGLLKNIKIYDGASHLLKHTLTYNFPSNTFFDHFYCAFFDVDDDGTKEMLHITSEEDISFINLQSNTIEFEIDTVVTCGVYDLDNDSHPEILCIKNTGAGATYTLQIWGSGTSAVSPSSSPLSKSLASLKPNVPNPFSSSTKIDYYSPLPRT